MIDFGSYLPIINSTLITIGVAFVAYNQFKSNQNTLSVSTAQILRDNINAKNVEIAQMKVDHDTSLALLKSDSEKSLAILTAQVATLTTQVESLKQANAVLQTTVSGRDILATIVEVLKPIPALFAPGGFIEEVRNNQAKTLSDLAEIKEVIISNSSATRRDQTHHQKNRVRTPDSQS